MKKYVLGLLLVLSSLAFAAQISAIVDFFAPTHPGTSDLSAAPIGSIIYDSIAGSFKGRASNGDWLDLSPSAFNEPWYISASIVGADINLGTSVITSWQYPSATGLTLVNRNPAVNVEIACATGGPQGSDCNTGSINEHMGIAFTPPAAGVYQACVSFSHRVTDSGGSLLSVFELVSTESGSTTVLQPGYARIQSGNASSNGSSKAASFPHRLCGLFSFSDTQEKAFRVRYEQYADVNLLTNVIVGDEAANIGERNIHFEVTQVK